MRWGFGFKFWRDMIFLRGDAMRKIGAPEIQPVNDADPIAKFSLYQRELINRLGWAVRCRWLVIFSLLLGLFYSRLTIHADLDVSLLMNFSLVLLLYNAIFSLINYLLRRDRMPARWKNISFAMAQILADLLMITAVVHWSGGAYSIFVVCYFFHAAMAAVLLRRWTCFLVAALASVLLDSVVFLEMIGYLHHYPLQGFTLGYNDLTQSLVIESVHIFCLVYNAALFITVGISSSVSERLRQSEQEIERINGQLTDVNVAKSHFMRVASHEMRSPLAAIIGLQDFAVGKLAKEGCSEETMHMINRCTIRARSLLDLINDLLDYSRIQTISIQERMNPVDLKAIIEDSIEELLPLAQTNGVDLKANLESNWVMGDEEHLATLCANLVNNALRYTPEGGMVRVSLRKRSSHVILEVVDNGIGVDKLALEHIFDEFFRASNAKRYEAAGTGLGLTLCKRIVEGHGGTISVSSEPDEQTVFTVSIPTCNVESSDNNEQYSKK